LIDLPRTSTTVTRTFSLMTTVSPILRVKYNKVRGSSLVAVIQNSREA
jgi:hypothetical protein